MAAEDYKVDVSLTSACGQELAELQCAKEQQGVDATVHLSTVLLSLRVLNCFSFSSEVRVASMSDTVSSRSTVLAVFLDTGLDSRTDTEVVFSRLRGVNGWASGES